jgi:hypothetical protein
VCVAVRASREVVIDAAPEAILAALADIESAPSWSPMHKRVEVLDKYDDGRPHRVKVHFRLMGFGDKEILEYHWGPDWVVWDAEETFQQHAQHVEYTLWPEAGKTRVRFDVTLEPRARPKDCGNGFSAPKPPTRTRNNYVCRAGSSTEATRRWRSTVAR